MSKRPDPTRSFYNKAKRIGILGVVVLSGALLLLAITVSRPQADGRRIPSFARVSGIDVKTDLSVMNERFGIHSRLETVPVSSTAFSPSYANAAPIVVTYTTAISDKFTLVGVGLYYKFEGHGSNTEWMDTQHISKEPSDEFSFSPKKGDGIYYFQTVAHAIKDHEPYTEPGPTADGDTKTIYDTTPLLLPLVLRNYVPPLTNGGFEHGWRGWQHGGELDRTITDKDRRSGSYSARLGDPAYPCRNGVPVGSAWMEQTFSVPSGFSALRIYYRIFSQDKLDGDRFDRFQILVNDQAVLVDGNQTDVYNCDHDAQSEGWEHFDVDVTSYVGISLTLRLENWSWPDGWYNTWTYVDDIQLLP